MRISVKVPQGYENKYCKKTAEERESIRLKMSSRLAELIG